MSPPSHESVRLIEYVANGDVTKIDGYLERYSGEADDVIATAFLHACRIVHFPAVERLLDHVNPNVRTADGFTGLMLAIERDSTGSMISVLIDRGCDPNLVDASGRTTLHYAAKFKNLAAVRILLKMGVNVNAHDRQGRTPLMYAAQNNAANIIYQLVHAGADTMKCTKTRRTALHFAVRQGCAQSVRQLLPFCSQPDLPDCQEISPLFLAVHLHHQEIVKLLLLNHPNSKRLDINRRCGQPHQRTPLEEAAAENQPKLVRLLLDADADPNSALCGPEQFANHNTLITPLPRSANNNHLPPLYLSSNGGARALITTATGVSTLTVASSPTVISGHHHATHRNALGGNSTGLLHSGLLTNGVVGNQVGTSLGTAGVTIPVPAIVYAVENGSMEMVEMLLEKKAKVNFPAWCRLKGYRRGTTPLLLAAELGHADMVRRLVEAGRREMASDSGAASDIVDGCDPELTPLTAAAGMGHYSVVEILLQMGANPAAPFPANIPALTRLIAKAVIHGPHWASVSAIFHQYPKAVAAVLNANVAGRLADLPENIDLHEGLVLLARHFPLSDLPLTAPLPSQVSFTDCDITGPYARFLGRYLSAILSDPGFSSSSKQLFDSLGNFPPRLVMRVLATDQVLKAVIDSRSIHSVYVLIEGLVDLGSARVDRLSCVEYAIFENNLECALLFSVVGGDTSFLHAYTRLTYNYLALGPVMPDWIKVMLQEFSSEPRSLQALCYHTIRRNLRPNVYLCTKEAWANLPLPISPSLKTRLAILRDDILPPGSIKTSSDISYPFWPSVTSQNEPYQGSEEEQLLRLQVERIPR